MMSDRDFIRYILNGLSANAILFSETFTHVRPEFIHWKPAPDKWCLMMLANWLAHDFLHMRQITRLKYEFLEVTAATDLGYAGSW